MNIITFKRSHILGFTLFVIDILIMLLWIFMFHIPNIVKADALYITLFLFVFANLDMYSLSNKKIYDILVSDIISFAFATGALCLYNFIAGIPWDIICSLSILNASLMLLWRIALNLFIKIFRIREKLLVIENKNVDNVLARKIKYSCLDWFDSWYTQIDVDDEDAINEFIEGEFSKYSKIFITQDIPFNLKSRLIDIAISQKKDIYIMPNMQEISITKYEMVQFDDAVSFKIKPFYLTFEQELLKRLFDITVGFVGTVLTAPLCLIISVLIKLDSRGPVFYLQERVTKDGKLFNIYKFRTMHKDAESMSGPILASRDDDRITRVGKVLRKLRIDEFPQFYNILKGDMSLVGPRPERPVFVEKYSKEIENYDKRLVVKAGLTGYAQVYGRYNTEAQYKLLYDLLYIREYSILLDIKIFLLTIKTLFIKDSSEGVYSGVSYCSRSEG